MRGGTVLIIWTSTTEKLVNGFLGLQTIGRGAIRLNCVKNMIETPRLRGRGRKARGLWAPAETVYGVDRLIHPLEHRPASARSLPNSAAESRRQDRGLFH